MGIDIAKQSEIISTILERMAYLEAFLMGNSEILCNKEVKFNFVHYLK